MRTKDRAALLVASLTLLLGLAGCGPLFGPRWQATVLAPDGSSFPVDAGLLERLAGEDAAEEMVALDAVLWAAGHRVVERALLTGQDGSQRELSWPDVAGDTWWQPDGRVAVAGELLAVDQVTVVPPARLQGVEASITDVAPTVAVALGLPVPGQATGHALAAPAVSRVLLLFLDGFGYVRYGEARDQGLIPNLETLGEPLLAMTTYPPRTSVSTASLLTGALPAIHGAVEQGIRQTEVETLFDVATAAGLQVVAVEGNALAFNLRSAELELSGDRDGNGSTDDNVLANALAVLDAGMPPLLFVHFHGIDDAGHSYGVGSPEEVAAIQGVDAAVAELLAAVPQETLVVLFADHGMHNVEEEGRLGNHGSLIERDMFIPILIVQVPGAPQ
mgnify:CR=1 FL=1